MNTALLHIRTTSHFPQQSLFQTRLVCGNTVDQRLFVQGLGVSYRHATPCHAEGRELPNSACPCRDRLVCAGAWGAKGSVCINTRGSSIANSLISSGRPINSGQWQLRVFAFSFPKARFLPRVNKQKRTSEKQAGFAPDYSRGFLGHRLGRGGAPRTVSGGREQEPFTARQSGGGWSYFYCYCLSTNLPMPNNDVVQSELFAINDS